MSAQPTEPAEEKKAAVAEQQKQKQFRSATKAGRFYNDYVSEQQTVQARPFNYTVSKDIQALPLEFPFHDFEAKLHADRKQLVTNFHEPERMWRIYQAKIGDLSLEGYKTSFGQYVKAQKMEMEGLMARAADARDQLGRKVKEWSRAQKSLEANARVAEDVLKMVEGLKRKERMGGEGGDRK